MFPDKPRRQHFPKFFPQNDIDATDAEKQAMAAAWEYFQTQADENEELIQENKDLRENLEISEQKKDSIRRSWRLNVFLFGVAWILLGFSAIVTDPNLPPLFWLIFIGGIVMVALFFRVLARR